MRAGRAHIRAGLRCASAMTRRCRHRMFAGGDAVLVPSRFEPCGLTQMYGLALWHPAGGGGDRRAGRYGDRGHPCHIGRRGGHGDRVSPDRCAGLWSGLDTAGRRCMPTQPSGRGCKAMRCAIRSAGRHRPRLCGAVCRIWSHERRSGAARLGGHATSPGRPWPMGATFDGDGVNFAVFSAHATRIELCLFSPDGRKEMARLPFRDRDGDIWHLHVGGLTPGTRLRLSRSWPL